MFVFVLGCSLCDVPYGVSNTSLVVVSTFHYNSWFVSLFNLIRNLGLSV